VAHCVELTDIERDQQAIAPDKLTAAVEHLHKTGYVVLCNALSSQPLERIRCRLDRDWSSFNSGKRPWLGGGRIIGHLGIHPLLYDEFIDRSLLANKIMISTASLALGGPVYFEGAGGNTNAPNSVPQEFHSDVNDWFAKRLLINIPVCDVDDHNGSLEAIPGTHDPGCKGRSIGDLLESHRAARVDTRLGSILIRFPFLIHRGMPNRSHHPRHMLTVWYTTSAVRTGNASKSTLDPSSKTFLEDYELMALEGMDDRLHPIFYPNIFPTGVAGMVKEHAYRHFPSMYRFAKAVTRRDRRSLSLGG